MQFVDREAILPRIRHLLPALDAAREATMAEPEPQRRSEIIRDNAHCWTALRDAFERASNDKCWYTECKTPGADNDVDHFRPKGAVRDERDHPGYYWEAFNWRNLRLSCQRANRPRRAPGADAAGGKSSWFPLLEGGLRAWGPGDDLGLELPALLDPTNPADPPLLTFLPNGEIDIAPDRRGEAAAEAKIKASRLALHLNWPKFVDARIELYNEVERLVERGNREAPADYEGIPHASHAFRDIIVDLANLKKPSAEYASAAKVYIESFRDIWWVRDVVLKL